MNNNNVYFTRDLGLATALSLFSPIQKINKSNPKKAEFLFVKNDEVIRLVDSFWQNNLKVDALTFFNQLKIVKTRLYENS